MNSDKKGPSESSSWDHILSEQLFINLSGQYISDNIELVVTWKF